MNWAFLRLRIAWWKDFPAGCGCLVKPQTGFAVVHSRGCLWEEFLLRLWFCARKCPTGCGRVLNIFEQVQGRVSRDWWESWSREGPLYWVSQGEKKDRPNSCWEVGSMSMDRSCGPRAWVSHCIKGERFFDPLFILVSLLGFKEMWPVLVGEGGDLSSGFSL